jgi:hypothetical protein
MSNILQVKVLLRISPSFPGETSSFLKVDQKKKQVTLYDPTAVSHVSQKYRRIGVAAPKMFAFDSIFEPDSSQVLCTFGKMNYILRSVASYGDKDTKHCVINTIPPMNYIISTVCFRLRFVALLSRMFCSQ